jgi:membrane-associated protein
MIGLSPENIVRTGGLIIVAAVVFAESGLLIGFFLPGDSLLFTAGFLASQNVVDIHLLAAICFIAAVAGDSAGYYFGNKAGPRLLKKPDGKIFKKQYISQAEAFYEKHGKKTIVMARFVPVVRTFAPIVAGIGNMKYHTFLTFNIIGGAIWALGLTYAGFFLGKSVPWAKDYLEIVIMGVIFLSLMPAIIHALSKAESRNALKKLPSATLRRIRQIIKKSN